jgi:hypothetical protein
MTAKEHIREALRLLKNNPCGCVASDSEIADWDKNQPNQSLDDDAFYDCASRAASELRAALAEIPG